MATFSQLLGILPRLEGKKAAALHARQILALPPYLPSSSSFALTPAAKELLNLSPATFNYTICRTTRAGKVSVVDAIWVFTGGDANGKWRRLENKDEFIFSYFKFPGSGQRQTPVATFSQLMRILPRLNGETAGALRARQYVAKNIDGYKVVSIHARAVKRARL